MNLVYRKLIYTLLSQLSSAYREMNADKSLCCTFSQLIASLADETLTFPSELKKNYFYFFIYNAVQNTLI